MSRYSLKKVMASELMAPKQGLLEEGFWTDLAVTLAAGGPAAVKQMAQNKIKSLLGKSEEVETSATLDMIARFKKMGLKNMWGQDLASMEKQLKRRSAKGKKKIDSKKLLAALQGLTGENTTQMESSDPFEKNRSLASVFLND